MRSDFYCGYLLLVLTVLVSSCDESRVEATRYHDLMPFHTVELNSVFEVYLTQDSSFSLAIKGDENAIKNVSFSLQEGILRIRNETEMKWRHPERNKIKLYITANRLTTILPNETCYITSLNAIISDDFQIIMGHHPKLAEIDLQLDCQTFYYWNNHQCGGKLTLTGNTGHLMLNTFAFMAVDALGLRTDNATIENNSKGDCEVFVNNRIEYSIRGVGNIYLHGQPEEIIVRDQTSSGELIEVN